jgi:hypothetical protein
MAVFSCNRAVPVAKFYIRQTKFGVFHTGHPLSVVASYCDFLWFSSVLLGECIQNRVGLIRSKFLHIHLPISIDTIGIKLIQLSVV